MKDLEKDALRADPVGWWLADKGLDKRGAGGLRGRGAEAEEDRRRFEKERSRVLLSGLRGRGREVRTTHIHNLGRRVKEKIKLVFYF